MFPPQWHNVLNILCSYLNGTMGPSKTRPAGQSGDVGLSALLHQILPVGHQRGLGDVAVLTITITIKETITLIMFSRLTFAMTP